MSGAKSSPPVVLPTPTFSLPPLGLRAAGGTACRPARVNGCLIENASATTPPGISRHEGRSLRRPLPPFAYVGHAVRTSLYFVPAYLHHVFPPARSSRGPRGGDRGGDNRRHSSGGAGRSAECRKYCWVLDKGKCTTGDLPRPQLTPRR